MLRGVGLMLCGTVPLVIVLMALFNNARAEEGRRTRFTSTEVPVAAIALLAASVGLPMGVPLMMLVQIDAIGAAQIATYGTLIAFAWLMFSRAAMRKREDGDQ